jgi:hypothetical protein
MVPICLFVLVFLGAISPLAIKPCASTTISWPEFSVVSWLLPYNNLYTLGRGSGKFSLAGINFFGDCRLKADFMQTLAFVWKEVAACERSTKTSNEPSCRLGIAFEKIMENCPDPGHCVDGDWINSHLNKDLMHAAYHGSKIQNTYAALLLARALIRENKSPSEAEKLCNMVIAINYSRVCTLTAKWLLANLFRISGEKKKELAICNDILHNYSDFHNSSALTYAKYRLEGRPLNRATVP